MRALSERLDATLPYDTLEQLRARLYADHPSFGQVDHAPTGVALDLAAVGAKGDVSDAAFASPIADFYLTNLDRAGERDHGAMLRQHRRRARPAVIAAE